MVYWYLGDRVKRISPYRKIEAKRDLRLNTDRKNFSKAKKVVELIFQRGHSSLNLTGRRDYTVAILNQIFDIGYNKLIEDINTHSNQSEIRRYGELSYTTIYNSLKFLPGESQLENP